MRNLKNPLRVGVWGIEMADPFIIISIGLEIGVFILLALASWKRDPRFLGLALAFFLYAAYDIVRLLELPFPYILVGVLLFLGSLSRSHSLPLSRSPDLPLSLSVRRDVD